jgi:hypothetical protein
MRASHQYQPLPLYLVSLSFWTFAEPPDFQNPVRHIKILYGYPRGTVRSSFLHGRRLYLANQRLLRRIFGSLGLPPSPSEKNRQVEQALKRYNCTLSERLSKQSRLYGLEQKQHVKL